MGKRHSIAAKKAAGDANKASNYAKIGKIIQMAAKSGADVSMNPSLELALQKARYYNLPRDVIDKAIKKWSGQLKWEDLQEIVYEWYGPGNSALVIKALTDNTNRSSSNIRTVMMKNWGNMAEMGSVLWQFKEKWFFLINGIKEVLFDKGKNIEIVHPLDLDQAEEELMVFDIEDILREEDALLVYVKKENYSNIAKELASMNFNIQDSWIEFVADNVLEIWTEEKERLVSLVDALEQDEDVNEVFCNVNL